MYSKEFAEKIAPSAGLRNALVHEYDIVDKNILQKSISEALEECNEYAKHIGDFLEKE